MWPTDADGLIDLQREIAALEPDRWKPPSTGADLAGCWACFPRGLTGPGHAGDTVWAAAVVLRDGRVADGCVRAGETSAAYEPGLLALRMGPAMETAVRGLHSPPDLLLLDATARDHPRHAGLALHLGHVLDLPTVGVTHRPLVGEGTWPADERGSTSPVLLGESVVACWLRTRPGTRPLVVHPGWRVDLDTAVDVVLEAAQRRTPEPLRAARRLAREARAGGRPR